MEKFPRQTAEDVVLMMIDEGKVIRINEEMFTMKHLMDEAKAKNSESSEGRKSDHDRTGERYVLNKQKECETDFRIYGQH